MANHAGEGSESLGDVEEGVADGVTEAGVGGGATGEEVIAVGVEGWMGGARAAGMEERVGEDGEAEFALEEEGEEVRWDAVLGVLAGEAVEWEASEWV